MIRLLNGLALVMMVLLSGCATLTPPPAEPVTSSADEALNAHWLQRQGELAGLRHWQFKSRASIRQDKESWQAGLRWKQESSRFEVQVLGPFSMGGIKLEGDDLKVILTLADGRRWQANAPDVLLEEATTRKLPISALRYWVRGLPALALPRAEKKLNEQAHITDMTQGVWQVKFTEYMKAGKHHLPRKIKIENTEQNLHVKMVIDKWTLGQ